MYTEMRFYSLFESSSFDKIKVYSVKGEISSIKSCHNLHVL